uniref:Uncharacterized protein n=1 Tax=Timema cristinae TaxID=61476 RepID=A0A7R9HDE9_TIMCR|nr:unnamed protein product [Timema cristinae]
MLAMKVEPLPTFKMKKDQSIHLIDQNNKRVPQTTLWLQQLALNLLQQQFFQQVLYLSLQTSPNLFHDLLSVLNALDQLNKYCNNIKVRRKKELNEETQELMGTRGGPYKPHSPSCPEVEVVAPHISYHLRYQWGWRCGGNGGCSCKAPQNLYVRGDCCL